MGGSDARALSRSLLDLCRMRKLTIATAESCTGGLVAGALALDLALDGLGGGGIAHQGLEVHGGDGQRGRLSG